MHKASRNAKLQDHRFPTMTPEAVLGEWSKLVEIDFKSITIYISPSSQSIDAKIDTMMKMIKMVDVTVNDSKTQNEVNVLTMQIRWHTLLSCKPRRKNYEKLSSVQTKNCLSS
jgi:hypothetical protein